ncbi:hypothetical protein KKI24_18905 [bacterium]|nr:hypothetical protein [bacterium]
MGQAIDPGLKSDRIFQSEKIGEWVKNIGKTDKPSLTELMIYEIYLKLNISCTHKILLPNSKHEFFLPFYWKTATVKMPTREQNRFSSSNIFIGNSEHVVYG